MTSDLLSIGRLGAPKGVRGDLKVQSYSGESAHFYRLRTVELRPERGAARAAEAAPLKLRVLRVEGTGVSLTIAFEGYPSPEAARALTGLELVVPRDAASPLGPNEWYIDDLVGLSLVVEGKKVGVVLSVLEGGAEPWLEVGRSAELERDSGSALEGGPRQSAKQGAADALIVPFRKVFVGEVDLTARTIELLAPWLLE